MMETSQGVLELITVAQANAKISEGRILDILKLMEGQNGSDAQVEELRAATVLLELEAVDIFSLFEARMQHHFKRGPFSRKLKSLLLESQQTDLADKVYQYYLAINVLKHGKGASYRELLNVPNSLFVVKSNEDIITDEEHPPAGLVDVSVPGFLMGWSRLFLELTIFLKIDRFLILFTRLNVRCRINLKAYFEFMVSFCKINPILKLTESILIFSKAYFGFGTFR